MTAQDDDVVERAAQVLRAARGLYDQTSKETPSNLYLDLARALSAANMLAGKAGRDPATIEACAGAVNELRTPQTLKLAAGEMTAQELRTAKAVLTTAIARIRALATQEKGR